MWVDATIHRAHNTFSGRYLTGWSITVETGSAISSGGATNYFGFLDMESGANGIEYHNHNAANLTAGTVPSARMVGAYTNITQVGTLSSLTVNGTLTHNGNNLGLVVLQTGNQTISGNKTFKNSLVADNQFSTPLIAPTLGNHEINVNNGQFNDDTPLVCLDWPQRILSGSWRAEALTVAGSDVITKALTGDFYPRSHNPAGYISSADLSSYVTTSQTGQFVGDHETGNFVNVFYPRNSNPNGYAVLSTDIQPAYVQISSTGAYANTFPTHTQTGQRLVGKNQTGIYSGSFYPLNSNPAGYLTSASVAPNLSYVSARVSTLTEGSSFGFDENVETDIISGTITSGTWLFNAMMHCQGSNQPVNCTFTLHDGTDSYVTGRAATITDAVALNIGMTSIISTTTTKNMIMKVLGFGDASKIYVLPNSEMNFVKINA
jgi:hypothetical protein